MTPKTTYGALPPRDVFEALFDRECSSQRYALTNHLLSGFYSCSGLWSLLESLVFNYEEGDKESGRLAQRILSDLGWEWV